MQRFHFDIRNGFSALDDRKGRHCTGVLEAVVLAKSALETLATDGLYRATPWIEIADETGNLVATVRLDELRN